MSSPLFTSTVVWCVETQFAAHSCGSVGITASLQSLVIPIRRPEQRGQAFSTRDGITSYNLAMKYTGTCDLIGRMQKACVCVCVFLHTRETHRESCESTDSAHSCWNSASLHHLMCCHSHPPKNKIYHTPLKCNEATLGVIILCCAHMECCGFLHFPS